MINGETQLKVREEKESEAKVLHPSIKYCLGLAVTFNWAYSSQFPSFGPKSGNEFGAVIPVAVLSLGVTLTLNDLL